MANGSTEINIARDPDTVWKVVSDYGGLASWLPGIETCTLEGDDRVLSMMGMTIRERLFERDDSAHTIRYGIVESPIGLERHEATITVAPGEGGSQVTWDVEVAPDTMLDLFVQTYEGGLAALKAAAENG